MRLVIASALIAAWTATAPLACAQEPLESYPFAGGTLTIAASSLEKVLAFDGRELARHYEVTYDRAADLSGTPVALFRVGEGGNLCGPATLIVWKPEGSDVKAETIGQECGSPPPAVADESIYFVPYLLPGASVTVQSWSPGKGLRSIGILSFAPTPGSTWEDLDPAKLDNIVAALNNEAVYAAAKKLLVDKLPGVVTGLLASGDIQTTSTGAFYASGCVPHACGSGDAFMGVDPAKQRVYFAQQDEEGRIGAWPRVKNWPGELRDAMKTALNPS